VASSVFDEPGFSTAVTLDEHELAIFTAAIERQWLDRIRVVHPEVVDTAASVGLASYHQLADVVDHQALWGSKAHRVLPDVDVDRLLGLPFVDRLRDELGPFRVAEPVYGEVIERGRRDIYWRIVRPNVPSDVGGLHADRWFHEVHARTNPDWSLDTRTAKVWIPIVCEPGRNGLGVVPMSHRRSWAWADDGHHTWLEDPVDPEDVLLLPTEPGTLVIFNERLLHVGVPNRATTTRISAELTLLFDQPAS